MVYRNLIIVSLIFFAPCFAFAQSAEDYFHGAAQSYIFGQKDKARAEIETGLKKYPNDPQLQKVAGLLKKEEQQQQQNQQGNSKENQDKSKQDQNSQANDQQKQQQQKQQSQGQNQKPDSQKQDQQSAAQQQASEQEKEKAAEEAKREAAMMAAGQMTPSQAKQLLDSQKDNERVFQIVPPNKQNSQSRSFKNW